MTDASASLADHLATADAAFDATNYLDAITAYAAALAIDADHVLAKYNLATAFVRVGRKRDAAEIFRQLVVQDAGLAGAAYNLALILDEGGKLDEAGDYYQRAIGAPSLALVHRPIAWLGLGVIFLKQGRFIEALAAFDAALTERPNFAEAYLNRGVALRSLGRDEEAIQSYRQALAIRPDYTRASINLADSYLTEGRHEDAVVLYRQILIRNPNQFDVLNNLGVALTSLDQLDEAIELLKRAVELRPNEASVHMHLGIALARAAVPGDALPHYRHAMELAPTSAPAWSNLGSGLHELGDFDAAIQCFQQSIALDSMFAPAHANQGITRLLTGDFAAGWSEYQWRLRSDASRFWSPQADADKWDRVEELAGKTLLITAEQGLGDTIQFCRFLASPRLADVRVVLKSPHALHGLIGESFPEVGLTDLGGEAPSVDAHQSLMSLPFLFQTRLETIPADVPYLRASPLKAAHWRRRLPNRDKPSVGLVWAGGSAYSNDRIRSLPFASLRRLAERTDIQLVSLQMEIPATDRPALDACGSITRLGEQVTDFADTAAIVASLDLVISVDTSVAHLAGAMARPVWILLPYIPDWRWLLGRDDSPWYPTARLFRQQDLGGWTGVMDRVGDALDAWVARGAKISLTKNYGH